MTIPAQQLEKSIEKAKSLIREHLDKPLKGLIFMGLYDDGDKEREAGFSAALLEDLIGMLISMIEQIKTDSSTSEFFIIQKQIEKVLSAPITTPTDATNTNS